MSKKSALKKNVKKLKKQVKSLKTALKKSEKKGAKLSKNYKNAMKKVKANGKRNKATKGKVTKSKKRA